MSQKSYSKVYTPQMAQRTTVIQRTSGNRSSMSGGFSYSSRSSMGPQFAAGTYSNLSSSGAANVRDSRQKEKKEMQGLNERLAGYIEQVRFLEARIKMLEDQLNQCMGQEKFDIQPIRDMYEGELNQARKIIDQMAKDKAAFDAKMAGFQDEVQRQAQLIDMYEKHKCDYVSKINQLTTQVGEYEGEVGACRMRISTLEDENEKLRDLYQKANEDIRKLRADLDNETAAHIEACNRCQTFEEECEFLRALVDKFPKEQKNVTQIQGIDMKVWWDKQLSQCIKDLQGEYDCVVSTMRDDMQMRMDAQYRQLQSGALKDNLESAHLKEEVKKLKGQLGNKNSALLAAETRIRELEADCNRMGADLAEANRELDALRAKYSADMDRLNSELEACLQEIQLIMDAKLSLELEICCYRQLLEGEENRAGLKHIVQQAVGVQSSGASKLSEFITSSSQSSQSTISSEASGRMTQSRSSRGNVSFVQCTVDGGFIEIENNTSGTKAKNQQLKGWSMKRTCPGKEDIVYNFEDITLKPGQKYRVYAKGAAPSKGQNVGCDYTVYEKCFSFGGGSGTTILCDESKQEKASLKATISQLK